MISHKQSLNSIFLTLNDVLLLAKPTCYIHFLAFLWIFGIIIEISLGNGRDCMLCESHGKTALHECDECHKALCSDCAHQPDGLDRTYCPECHNARVEKEITLQRQALRHHIVMTMILSAIYLIGMVFLVYLTADNTDASRWLGLLFIVCAGILTARDLEYRARMKSRGVLMTENGSHQSILFFYALSILLGIVVIPLYIVYRIVTIPFYLKIIKKKLPMRFVDQ